MLYKLTLTRKEVLKPWKHLFLQPDKGSATLTDLQQFKHID
jgi:hypothetical protein